MKNPTLLKAYREALRRLNAEQNIIMSGVNGLLRGQDVRIKNGRFNGYLAEVKDYYFDAGNEYLHVILHRHDLSGERPKDVIELEDCEIL